MAFTFRVLTHSWYKSQPSQPAVTCTFFEPLRTLFWEWYMVFTIANENTVKEKLNFKIHQDRAVCIWYGVYNCHERNWIESNFKIHQDRAVCRWSDIWCLLGAAADGGDPSKPASLGSTLRFFIAMIRIVINFNFHEIVIHILILSNIKTSLGPLHPKFFHLYDHHFFTFFDYFHPLDIFCHHFPSLWS